MKRRNTYRRHVQIIHRTNSLSQINLTKNKLLLTFRIIYIYSFYTIKNKFFSSKSIGLLRLHKDIMMIQHPDLIFPPFDE